MNLPQYTQKLNPNAALLSDRAPSASLDGLSTLTKTLSNLLDGVNEYRDNLNLSNAKKEYELWLTQERTNFERNTTIDNLEQASYSFNQRATNKIDEVLRKSGVSWTAMRKASGQMQATYCPNNLSYSIQIGEKIKLKAYEADEFNYNNDLGNLMSSATVAQLRGENGHAFLSSALDSAEQSVDRAVSSGYIPAYARNYLVSTKKTKATAMFFGRLLKESPQDAYDFVTHSSKQVVMAQADYFEKHAHTPTYQTYYSKTQTNYEAYQKELNTLTAQEKQRLGIKNVYVNNELSTNSYQYNLGALYDEAKTQGMSLAEAVRNSEMLAKYATPYSPFFSTSSIYYNNQTADFAGHWRGTQYIPASLTKTSRYYNEALGYLNPEIIDAVQSSYATYDSAAKKQAQGEKAKVEAQKIYKLEQELAAGNILLDPPVKVDYTNGPNKKPDPYAKIPMPTKFLNTAEIKALIRKEAIAQGVPVEAAMALFERESNFNPKARGAAGEYSLGQLMPETAQALGVTNPWDSQQNIRAALKYYKQALVKANGDPVAAYAGYNGGLKSIAYYKNGTASQQLKNNVAGYNKIYVRYKNGK